MLIWTTNYAELSPYYAWDLSSEHFVFYKTKITKGGNLYVSKSNVADSVRTTLLGLLYILGSKRSTDGENSI